MPSWANAGYFPAILSYLKVGRVRLVGLIGTVGLLGLVVLVSLFGLVGLFWLGCRVGLMLGIFLLFYHT